MQATGSQKAAPIEVANRLFRERYPEAQVIFLAGSAARNQTDAFSDLDLLVIFSRLPNAYRESFVFMDWPVEVFVHDFETLKYFFLDDVPSGNPATLRMVTEGIEIPGASPVSRSIRDLASSILSAGPLPFADDEEQRFRYMISSIITDIKKPRSHEELMAAGVNLYEKVGYYFFRSRGIWGNAGKLLPRTMSQAEPEFARQFNEAFVALFGGNPEKVIRLVADLFAPRGGLLFDGYHYDAPHVWRTPLRSDKSDDNQKLTTGSR